MSTKIKISYEHDWELQEIIQLLQPVIKRYKEASKQGKYSRVYIELKK